MSDDKLIDYNYFSIAFNALLEEPTYARIWENLACSKFYEFLVIYIYIW